MRPSSSEVVRNVGVEFCQENVLLSRVCADPLCNLLVARKDTLAIFTWVSTSFVSRCIVGVGLPGSRIW